MLLDFGKQGDCAARPHRPVTEQSAENSCALAAEVEFGQKIGNDVVVIAGVECHVVSPALDDRADNIECLIAIERRDLDGDYLWNLCEFTPELVGQETSADGRLQVEADDGDDLGNCSRMIEQLGDRSITQCGKTE